MSLSGDKGVAQFKKSVKMEHPSDNGNRKNNVVDNGDENEDEDKLNVSLGFLPFLIGW